MSRSRQRERAPITGSFVQYGQGCTGPNGIPDLDATPGSQPCIGSPFTVTLTNLPSSPLNLTFGLFGLDDTTWNGQPLPVALDPYGFTGCSAWLAPLQVESITHVGGVANWNIGIPMRLDLLGLDFYVQGTVLTPGFGGGLAFSNAGHAVVGSP